MDKLTPQPIGTQNLLRSRPPFHLLPAGEDLPPDPYKKEIERVLGRACPHGKTIAFDLDETLLARRSSCPQSWDPAPAPPTPELYFHKMRPAPRRLISWLFGDRSNRDLYSRKHYPFLSTKPELTQVRPGFLPLLHALKENRNTLLLITACDSYRLDYLNRRIPDLFAPFASRQIPLEEIASHTACLPDRSVLEKTPELATLVGCEPFDLLIDDSPHAANHLRATGQEKRILSFEPNSKPEIVMTEVLEKLTGNKLTPLPPPPPTTSFSFLDSCYLAAEPDSILPHS